MECVVQLRREVNFNFNERKIMETKEITFGGGSDDLCYVVSKDKHYAEYCNIQGEFRILIKSPENDTAWVNIQYGKEGQRNLGLGLVEDDSNSDSEFYPMPEWRIKFGWDGKYSAVLKIDLPIGTKITRTVDDEDDEDDENDVLVVE